MLRELKESWEAYHLNPEMQLEELRLYDLLEPMSRRVLEARLFVEKYLLECVESASSGNTCHRLRRLINHAPTPTTTDLIRNAMDLQVRRILLPSANSKALAAFKNTTLQFIELCVLEDKLERLTAHTRKTPPPPHSYFVDELSSAQQWSSQERPFWLALEVEARL